MIEQVIVDLFADLGHTWSVVAPDGTRRDKQPDDSDIEIVLDEAVKNLYNEDVGARFNVGGLIIEKLQVGYDVYAYVGHYI